MTAGTGSSGDVRIHATAEVSPGATIGAGSQIWNQSQVRESSTLGEECIVGKNVYIDTDVNIGNRVKLQNNSSLYHPLRIEDGVFIGPHVIFTNDRVPRAINPDGTLKGTDDWDALQTRVGYGAAIGAGAVILPGLRLGTWCLVGSGSIVTRDVPDRGIVAGNPARLLGFACDCGARLHVAEGGHRCQSCGRQYELLQLEAAE